MLILTNPDVHHYFDTAFRKCIDARESPEVAVTEAVASNCKPSERSVQWLALALTPGLGPTKARRVIEFFGSVQALFRASLTELEAAGLRAVSAQALGTGRSMEMAQDELGKAAAADARIVALEESRILDAIEADLRSSTDSLRARE
jgi:hypothetical protein